MLLQKLLKFRTEQPPSLALPLATAMVMDVTKMGSGWWWWWCVCVCVMGGGGGGGGKNLDTRPKGDEKIEGNEFPPSPETYTLIGQFFGAAHC